jgi:hypothetical protein
LDGADTIFNNILTSAVGFSENTTITLTARLSVTIWLKDRRLLFMHMPNNCMNSNRYVSPMDELAFSELQYLPDLTPHHPQTTSPATFLTLLRLVAFLFLLLHFCSFWKN